MTSAGTVARERRDEVHWWAAPLHRVQPLGGDLLHPLGERAHPAHREVAGEQAPQAGVLRRVDPREVARRRRWKLGRRAWDRQVRELVPGAEATVGQHGAVRVITGGQPALVAVRIGHPHRVAFADLGQFGGRVERPVGPALVGQAG